MFLNVKKKNSKKILINPIEEVKEVFNFLRNYQKNKEKQKAKFERELKSRNKEI